MCAAAAAVVAGAADAAPAAAVAPLSPAASALLSYLKGLPASPKHVLSGQHSSYWDSNALDYVQVTEKQTGKSVAILGTTSGQAGSTQDGVALSNRWLDNHGIVLLSWWPSNPFTGSYGPMSPASPGNFAQLTLPGTRGYVAWYKLLDDQIAQLKKIKGPVLYRPFVELNGNWSWWQNQDPATFIAVWRQMHDYFVSNGVDNALWVYNVNTGRGRYTDYYPGPSYVDVLAMDAYPPSVVDLPMYDALVALNQPIIYAETGVTNPDNSKVAPFGADNSKLLAVVKDKFPKVVGVVIFCQNYGIPQQFGARELMNDPAVITRSDLPSGF
jgi:mannan endo-1,4-beta-mannosidase